LAHALTSVLEQDRGRDQMEIIVVDDHSTKDDPLDIVKGLGQRRIQFIRQSENVGKARNFQTGLEASRGHLIHQLHGDDLVGEGFYRSMEDAFTQFPEAGAFFCESEYIAADGSKLGRTGKETTDVEILKNWLARMVVAQRVQTPSIVVRRIVYETLGGFDIRLPNFEDWEMWVRIATIFPFGFNPHVIAKYRVYSGSTSAKSIVSGERAKMLSRAISIMDSYLPTAVLSRYKRERSRETAQYLIRCIPQARASKKPIAWLRLCSEVIRYSVRPRELYYLLNFSLFYKRYFNK
jgi:glycosyltransferase involved in cell wall biosynthesis